MKFKVTLLMAMAVSLAAFAAGDRFVPVEKIDWNKADKVHQHMGRPDVRMVKVERKSDGHLTKGYLMRVDLASYMKFTATPRAANWNEPMPKDPNNNGSTIKTLRVKTVDFAKSVAKRKLNGKHAKPIVAFNTSPWGPWPSPQHMYASPNGFTISDGEFVCGGRRNAHFVVYKDNTVDIVNSIPDDQTNKVWIAHCGFQLLMKDGNELVANFNRQDIHPRMGVGLTPDKKTLYLLAIDGRMKGWSDGANLQDMVAIFKAVGVTDAVNMDGGGSTSLCVPVHGEPALLNKSENRRTALNICIYE